jgi:hypothetical protein
MPMTTIDLSDAQVTALLNLLYGGEEHLSKQDLEQIDRELPPLAHRLHQENERLIRQQS